MPRLPVVLVSGLVIGIFGAGSVVSAKASLDEAAREHDQTVARALPGAVRAAFEKRGISLASSSIDPSPLETTSFASLLEYPAAWLPGNNCFAICFFEEKLRRLPSGWGRVSCQAILRQRRHRRAAPTERGTLVGDHYFVVYSLRLRLLRLVEATLAAAVRADR